MESWVGNFPSSETMPDLVFTPTLKAFVTLLARISDLTFVVIQLSDTTRSVFLAVEEATPVGVSAAACAHTPLQTKAAANSTAPIRSVGSGLLREFFGLVMGAFSCQIGMIPVMLWKRVCFHSAEGENATAEMKCLFASKHSASYSSCPPPTVVCVLTAGPAITPKNRGHFPNKFAGIS
jgi:hypothetical protein